ncbi:MAG: cobalamin biosynthesis protein, partial [Nitratireductor sp.]
MFETGLTILIIALVIDWFLGEPDFIWSNIPHPVVLFGRSISWLDKKYNTSDFSDAQRFRNGAASICGLIIGAVLIASYIDLIISYSGFLGTIVEILIVFTLIAQKSLYDHVKAVLIGFRTQGLRGGRRAVAQIVGRDVEKLNEEGVIRASIETLAENFSDGVVAPAFWYA